MSLENRQKKIKEKLVSMPKDILTDFKKLLTIQSSSSNEHEMVAYIVTELNKIDNLLYHFDSIGNILVTKGYSAIYPCIVGHMDTVHRIHENGIKIHVSNKSHQIASASNNGTQVGIGGDDKCGVYSTLYMLKTIDDIKAVFFTQEESGCIGSGNVDMEFFKDVGYIIQLDRWGRGDLISIVYGDTTVSTEFSSTISPLMTKYGYENEQGLITDSINLWDNGVGVSCVNVSCGYYQHHTNSETIDLNEFWNSVLFARDMILKLGNRMYLSKPTGNSYDSFWDNEGNIINSYKADYNSGILHYDDYDDVIDYIVNHIDSHYTVVELFSGSSEFNECMKQANEIHVAFGYDELTEEEFAEFLRYYM